MGLIFDGPHRAAVPGSQRSATYSSRYRAAGSATGLMHLEMSKSATMPFIHPSVSCVFETNPTPLCEGMRGELEAHNLKVAGSNPAPATKANP